MKLQTSPLIIDGGTGTELERVGAPMNSDAWSAEAVLSSPGLLRGVHRSFLDAGAQLIIANTFSTALHNLEAAGIGDKFEQINSDAVRLVKEAIGDRECIAAGAISTTTFSGPLDYSRLLSGDAAANQYARQAEIQVEAGAELIILEMMRDIEQTSYALEGAVRSGVPVWIGFTCFLEEDDTVNLLDTDIPLRRALREVELDKAAAVGVMHTLVEHASAAVSVLNRHWDGYSFAYPHAGHFVMPNWIFQDVITPYEFAQACDELCWAGVDAVGGCCGIGPLHIQALSERRKLELTVDLEIVKIRSRQDTTYIGAFRIHAGLSQAEVASSLGISLPEYEELERTETPQAAILDRLSEIIGAKTCVLYDLYYGEK